MITPQATLSASGFCHNLPVEGSPHAGEVILRADGVPMVPVFLGTVAGRPVVINVLGAEWIADAEGALLRATVELAMWQQDHEHGNGQDGMPLAGEAA